MYTTKVHNIPSENGGHLHIESLTYNQKSKSGKDDGAKIVTHLVFQHDIYGHSHLYKDFFKALFVSFKSEIIISTVDITGFGRSGGNRGKIKDAQSLEKDMISFYHFLEEEYEAAKHRRVFLGIGFGVILNLNNLFGEHAKHNLKIDKIININSLFGFKYENALKARGRALRIKRALNLLEYDLNYNIYDLTDSKEYQSRLVSDLLINKVIGNKLFNYIQRSLSEVQSFSYFLNVPSLFINSRSPISDTNKIDLFITGMKKEFVKCKAVDSDCHDLLIDTCRNDVYEEIINYIKE